MKKQKTKATQITFSLNYRGVSIFYDVWQSDPEIKPTAILFLGAAQAGPIVGWVADHCPPGTLIVQGVPHWLVTDEDISDFAITYVTTAFETLLEHFGLERVDLLAESQATPGVIKLFANVARAKRIGSLFLIQPLGLNASTFTNTSDPFNLFLRRTAQNAKYLARQILDSKLYHNTRQMVKYLKFRDPLFRAHYVTGISQDISIELKQIFISGQHEIMIICGTEDKLFPPEEIENTLRKNKIDLSIHLVPGIAHAPLATKQGQKLLDAAFNTLHTQRKNRP